MPRKKKAKSAIKIGKDNEAEYEKRKQEDGYLTYRPPKGSRWEANKDIFNMFDILAMDKSGIELIQVKTNQSGGSLKAIAQWVKDNEDKIPDNVSIELAIKKKATKRKPMRWVVTVIDREGGEC